MNVIVIMADSWRVDHLGCYGNNWIQTPNLDRFADESCVFDLAFAEGLPTIPTRTSLFTGRYTFPFRGWQRLEHDDILLAETLWSSGYTSALISDTYHMHKPRMAFERGFDYVHFIRGQEGDPHILDKSIQIDVDAYHQSSRDVDASENVRNQLEQYLRNRSHWQGDEDHFIAQVVKSSLHWIENQPEKDGLFLWMDCFDPHEPWDPPEPFNRMYQPDYEGKELIHPIPGEVDGYLTAEDLKCVQALYAGEISLVDKWLGIFLERLRELGMFDNTLIVFMSDHGEPLGEGKWGHGIMRKARPWPYEELVHIPLIIRHPEGIGCGKRRSAFAQPPDIMPTILDYLGIVGPGGMHGQSLIPIMSGQIKKIRDYAYTGFYLKSWSIRTPDWSYIWWLPTLPRIEQTMPGTLGAISCTLVGSLETPPKAELYNRKTDLYELKNLVDVCPRISKDLELQLRRFVEQLY